MTGAITHASPSRPRYGPRVPTFVVGFRPGGRIVIFLRAIAPGSLRTDAVTRDHPIQLPTVGDALELVRARIVERKAASGDQVLPRLRHEDLRRRGERRDTGADRH